jgi:hypothetical protein
MGEVGLYNEIVQNSKSEPKKFSILCAFKTKLYQLGIHDRDYYIRLVRIESRPRVKPIFCMLIDTIKGSVS